MTHIGQAVYSLHKMMKKSYMYLNNIFLYMYL